MLLQPKLLNNQVLITFQIPGGVTAANGFKAAGIYGGLRAKGEKPDLALVTCDVDAISAGSLSFQWNDLICLLIINNCSYKVLYLQL